MSERERERERQLERYIATYVIHCKSRSTCIQVSLCYIYNYNYVCLSGLRQLLQFSFLKLI